MARWVAQSPQGPSLIPLGGTKQRSIAPVLRQDKKGVKWWQRNHVDHDTREIPSGNGQIIHIYLRLKIINLVLTMIICPVMNVSKV